MQRFIAFVANGLGGIPRTRRRQLLLVQFNVTTPQKGDVPPPPGNQRAQAVYRRLWIGRSLRQHLGRQSEQRIDDDVRIHANSPGIVQSMRPRLFQRLARLIGLPGALPTWVGFVLQHIAFRLSLLERCKRLALALVSIFFCLSEAIGLLVVGVAPQRLHPVSDNRAHLPGYFVGIAGASLGLLCLLPVGLTPIVRLAGIV
ncbi:hypothetical protein XpopCFBP1817_18680 [Xanthomonas populi]|uniref:Uncharacterized protein n=1 Tax=Xanthomonas populi TaxID=53414 RepID=A0A2S7EA83_9XANT|nr:hypothetical protein XpopCFBP1817_18680 [Xanthomonas populi]